MINSRCVKYLNVKLKAYEYQKNTRMNFSITWGGKTFLNCDSEFDFLSPQTTLTTIKALWVA